MKKIIWGLVVLLFWFLGYSTSVYLESNQCPTISSPWCKTWYSISGCIVDGNRIYIPYTKTNGQHKTWSVNLCVWETYWNTWRISWLWCYAPKWCCRVWSVVTSNGKCKSCDSLTEAEAAGLDSTNCSAGCADSKKYTLGNWLEWCCEWIVDNDVCYPSLSQYGINLDTECLINWQCSLNVYKVMWIREQDPNPTVLWFFQDITLATTTAILWTLITVALVLSWLYFAICSVTGKEPKKAKEIIKACFGWLLLVMSSYAIIRLVQFLATAWS